MQSPSPNDPARNLGSADPERTETAVLLLYRGGGMARVVREGALLHQQEIGAVLGLELPARSFARAHPDPSSRGGCFRPAAVGLTQRPARAFHALAFPLADFLFSEVAGFVLFSGSGAFPNLRMPVKRSLKLDGLLEENSFDPSKITRKKSVITYSPTTGTCQMSLFASPTSSEEQKHRNGLSNGLCWKP
eukprot:XP_016856345.1 centromere protein R isoform X4 [Homo sapiens]